MNTYAKLKPLKHNEPGRSKPWLLSVPPALSGTGKRQKLYFTTKDEADEAAEIYHVNRTNGDASLKSLTPTGILEAAEAYKILRESPFANTVTLTDCVRTAIEFYAGQAKSVTFAFLCEKYLEARSHV